ncbi:formylglycine-generating enzyme family protein [Thiothrix subterranea]|uniref:formylglycine-generating enzyme family protein n=1 Tax=Thiothrix subterranea TaxID=2735563 RepID=UPI001D198303|nr:formylglycine-generating enzyme family protein [Thiothrix subterranea]
MSAYRNHLSPPVFPYAWASDWGEDRYGLWQAFTYKNVRHAFRWIQPGTFMMGSPEAEEGRDSDEDLHKVTITQGFWLAETTVTQALWQITMGENPSHFKSDKRPVETVSWEDSHAFIDKLNQIHSDLSVRLPWEAEWEYACRAGTKTLFNFGDKQDLTLEKVNYSGKWDDSDIKGETKDVKTYPCNAWGLYEMHGNVWEWCEDMWRDHLGKDVVSNPKAVARDDQEASILQVVRGGSWGSNGGFARSASRHKFYRNDRRALLGFRLAIGLELQSAQHDAKRLQGKT